MYGDGERVKIQVDINTLHRIEDIDKIEMNDIGRISMRTSKPLFYDVYKKNRKQVVLLLLTSKPMKPLEQG